MPTGRAGRHAYDYHHGLRAVQGAYDSVLAVNGVYPLDDYLRLIKPGGSRNRLVLLALGVVLGHGRDLVDGVHDLAQGLRQVQRVDLGQVADLDLVLAQ